MTEINFKEEISDLVNNLIPLAEFPNRNGALPDHIRQCEGCKNLVDKEGNKVELTRFQRRYLVNHYRGRIALGWDRECHKRY